MVSKSFVYLYNGLAFIVEKFFEFISWLFSKLFFEMKSKHGNNSKHEMKSNSEEVVDKKSRSKVSIEEEMDVNKTNKGTLSEKINKIFSKNKRELSKHEPLSQDFEVIRNKKGKLDVFENFLYTNKSTIGIILGARGTGKSAIGMALLENFAVKTDKNIYAMGFKQSALPRWIEVVKEISQINNNSILLVDEGGVEFSSRDAMSNSNKLLSEILLIARHKDLSVMFITQNSSNLEINAIRQADYLILKPSSLLQKDFERKKIKDVYSKVDIDFEELKGEQGLTYFYSDKYCGFIKNNLPSFWSEKVSKGYSGK